MRIFAAVGFLLFGVIAVAGVIYPFIQAMLPTLVSIDSTPYEIAYWGLLPILLLVLIIPAALYYVFKKDDNS